MHRINIKYFSTFIGVQYYDLYNAMAELVLNIRLKQQIKAHQHWIV